MTKPWYVYMVRCAKNALYTGITQDVVNRVAQHNAGTGAKAVKALGLPVTLVYTETVDTKGAALKREYEIKQLPKSYKENMIKSPRNEINRPL